MRSLLFEPSLEKELYFYLNSEVKLKYELTKYKLMHYTTEIARRNINMNILIRFQSTKLTDERTNMENRTISLTIDILNCHIYTDKENIYR